MPTMIEMLLEAARPLQASTRQLHGLACAIFEGAQSGDHTGNEKPFTIWPLRHASAETGKDWLLRLAWLRAGLPQTVLAACGQLRLGSVACTVADVACHPVTHSQLATDPPCEAAEITFCSP